MQNKYFFKAIFIFRGLSSSLSVRPAAPALAGQQLQLTDNFANLCMYQSLAVPASLRQSPPVPNIPRQFLPVTTSPYHSLSVPIASHERNFVLVLRKKLIFACVFFFIFRPVFGHGHLGHP